MAVLHKDTEVRSREILEKPNKKYSGIDEPFTVLVLLLLLIGLVCLYSASYVTALKRQVSATAFMGNRRK